MRCVLCVVLVFQRALWDLRRSFLGVLLPTVMISKLESLPLDVIYSIIPYLDFEDLINLSRTSRHLNLALSEEKVCRRSIQVGLLCQSNEQLLRCSFLHDRRQAHIAHTKEYGLSCQGRITCMKAAERVFYRREAFATASPSSALVVGFGASFIYRQGILCYRSNDSFRILNVHDSGQVEKVIHLPTLISDEIKGDAKHCRGAITILNLSEGILVCFYAIGKPIKEAYVLAIRINTEIHESARCLIRHPLENTERLFARNNRSFLCCGIHTCLGADGRRGWTITCLSLSAGETKKQQINLHNFAGSEIGATVCFDIHQGYFYAVSTQSSFDAEAHNWLSYYHCYRFSLDDPQQEQLEQGRIWRRNHTEGPINNSWTTLRLHVDESSGNLVIVEIRREWLDGASSSQRTYYTQPMDRIDWHLRHPLRNPQVQDTMESQLEDTTLNNLDGNYPAATRLRWWDYRPPRYTHPGVDHLDHIPRFSLSSTKLQYFDPSSITFLSLAYSLEEQLNGDDRQLRPRIRLQIGSRQLGPPRKREDELLVQPEIDEKTGLEKEGSEEFWKERGPWLWPADISSDTSQQSLKQRKLDRILCSFCSPQDQQGQIVAAADERSIVYSCGPSTSASQAIILINFDPAIRFPGLETSNPQPRQAASSIYISKGERDKARIDGEDSSISTTRHNSRWIREEKAQYLRIGMGVQL